MKLLIVTLALTILHAQPIKCSVIKQHELENICEEIKIWGILKHFKSPVYVDYSDKLDSLLFKTLEDGHMEMLRPYLTSFKQTDTSDVLSQLKLKCSPEVMVLLSKWVKNGGTKFAKTKQKRQGAIWYDNEQALPHFDFKNDNHRLYGAATFWNHLYYFHPFLDRSMWVDSLPGLVKAIITASDESAYHQVLIRYFTPILDQHALYYNPVVANNLYGSHFRPHLRIRKSHGEYIIIHSTVEDSIEYVGGKLLEINGQHPVNREKEIKQWMPRSGKALENYFNMLLLEGKKDDTLLLSIMLKDSTIVSLEAVCDTPTLIQLKRKLPEIPNDICYLNPTTAQSDKQLRRMFKEIRNKNSIGCIIDLRGHVNFYPSDKDLAYLSQNRRKTRQYHYGIESAPGSFATINAGLPFWSFFGKKYTCPVAVVIDEFTASSSELLTIELITLGAFTVGTNSRGATGSVAYFNMPDGTKITYTRTGFGFPDGQYVFGTGITPDFWVERSFTNYLTTDNVILKASELVRAKK